ncbi:hypothetical protein FRC17_009977 [Serendipita sp. 399]|nr:hypothetical protein FRC17_009977 [Serendipita sp. 399]
MTSKPSTKAKENDPEEARIAHFETEENFRWISSLLATTSSVELDELVPTATQEAIYAIAEFAEVAHGSIDPHWIFSGENRGLLGDAGFPLEQYPSLGGKVDGVMEPIELVKVFHGERGQLQGYCALRPQPRTPAHVNAVGDTGSTPVTQRPQIILAFSGTSNRTLALYDIHAALAPYKSKFQHVSKSTWRVHSGFQLVYQAIKPLAFDALQEAIQRLKTVHEQEDYDLVITAHSLGGAVSYLALLDLLHNALGVEGTDTQVPRISEACNLTIAVFGAPRLGNSALASHFRETAQEWQKKCGRDEALTEWPIIGHMDGVPSLPPSSLGYTPFYTDPLYSFGGHLYVIPSSEIKYTHFKVKPPDDYKIIHRRGGHNYYGARDMERLQRRMKAIKQDLSLPIITTYSNMPTRRHSLGSSSTKEVETPPHSRPSDRLKRTTRSISSALYFSKKRRSSLEEHVASPEEGSAEASEAGPIIANEVTSEPPSQLDSNPDWIKRYLERERAEEDVWKRKTSGKVLWDYVGTLGRARIFSQSNKYT